MYMDWMHEKYLRNQVQEEVEAEYRAHRGNPACGMRARPLRYPVRLAGKPRFESVVGFQAHPNTREKM